MFAILLYVGLIGGSLNALLLARQLRLCSFAAAAKVSA